MVALWILEAGPAKGAVAAKLEASCDLLIKHADGIPTTLKQIKAGNIHMSPNPNQGVKGFMGFVAVHLAHRLNVFEPFKDWKTAGFYPVQTPFRDSALAVIAQDSTDSFDRNVEIGGRDPA